MQPQRGFITLEICALIDPELFQIRGDEFGEGWRGGSRSTRWSRWCRWLSLLQIRMNRCDDGGGGFTLPIRRQVIPQDRAIPFPPVPVRQDGPHSPCSRTAINVHPAAFEVGST